MFGTSSREYCSNVYKINIATLESEKLFDSLQILEENYFNEDGLNDQYPNQFLHGRYLIYIEN
jgi:hypothetical protein